MTTIKEIETNSRNELITEWYITMFPKVAAYFHKNGGDLNLSKEIFQEALIIYFEKISCANFTAESSDEAYIMGIVKNLWLKYCANQKRFVALNSLDIAEEKQSEPIKQKLLNYLQRTGEKCMNLLQAFYYENLNMDQLANRFGYTSVRSATVQKYKCLEKVRDQVKHKSLEYEDFLN